jgi:Spy/CpxP family protein refolding chaperone
MTHTILAHLLSMMTMLVAPGAADEPGARGRHDKGAALCERLECTDDQRARIDAIRAEHREDAADERAEAKRLRQALRAEQSKPSPDAEELARLRASLETMKTSLRQQREVSKAEISALLTPEQRERLDAMKAERERGPKGKAHAKRGKGKGKGKGNAKGKAHAKRGKGKAGAERARGRAA